jgi:Common central domain of tyrosinase/Bacterial TSP3 repeat
LCPTSPFHNSRHVAVGGEDGDISFTDSAPQDPIFWKYHEFIDNISAQRFFPFFAPLINLNAAEASASGAVIANLGVDTVPPRVISQNPFRLSPYITSLPKISDKEGPLFGVTNVTALSAEFSEPVTGVKPNDFTVNGSPATQVSGTGAGPSVFIGFKNPGIGPINLTLSSGNISDISGNGFAGSSWNYFLVKSNVDKDRDGLKDELEVNLSKTNPTKSDSDGDGISDGIEATSKCLNPHANDAMLMDMSMNVVNKTGIDTDGDNKTMSKKLRPRQTHVYLTDL